MGLLNIIEKGKKLYNDATSKAKDIVQKAETKIVNVFSATDSNPNAELCEKLGITPKTLNLILEKYPDFLNKNLTEQIQIVQQLQLEMQSQIEQTQGATTPNPQAQSNNSGESNEPDASNNGLLKRFTNWVGDGYTQLKDGVVNWVGEKLDQLNENCKGVVDWASEGCKKLKDGVVNYVKSVPDKIKEVATSVGNLFETCTDGIGEFFTNTKNTVVEYWDKIVSHNDTDDTNLPVDVDNSSLPERVVHNTSSGTTKNENSDNLFRESNTSSTAAETTSWHIPYKKDDSDVSESSRNLFFTNSETYQFTFEQTQFVSTNNNTQTQKSAENQPVKEDAEKNLIESYQKGEISKEDFVNELSGLSNLSDILKRNKEIIKLFSIKDCDKIPSLVNVFVSQNRGLEIISQCSLATGNEAIKLMKKDSEMCKKLVAVNPARLSKATQMELQESGKLQQTASNKNITFRA